MTTNPFRIANPTLESAGSPTDQQPDRGARSPLERVEAMVRSAPVFLFMKGVPNAPRCGFSANAVELWTP
jgi:hypothetical protein